MDSIVKHKKSGKNKKVKSADRVKTKQEMLKSFFGKLPKIEDGLVYQKKVRNEW